MCEKMSQRHPQTENLPSDLLICCDILVTFSDSVSVRSLITYIQSSVCSYQFAFGLFPFSFFTQLRSPESFQFFQLDYHCCIPELISLPCIFSFISYPCLNVCFPTQEASVVPRDHLRLYDHHRSSSRALLPWFFKLGVQHAYALTGLTLIWGQKTPK